MDKKILVPIIGSILLCLVLWGFKISGERIEAAQSKAASEKYGQEKDQKQFLEKQERLKMMQEEQNVSSVSPTISP